MGVDGSANPHAQVSGVRQLHALAQVPIEVDPPSEHLDGCTEGPRVVGHDFRAEVEHEVRAAQQALPRDGDALVIRREHLGVEQGGCAEDPHPLAGRPDAPSSRPCVRAFAMLKVL